MTLRFGRYETIQPLATGGMAAVYLGRAVGAGGFERRVAIKVMHGHIADDPDFVAMFLDEARLAARIHHPNVVGTIDVQEGAEGMFLVMEYIEGASLKHVLRGMRKRKQRIPYGISARIICDALNGLHAAHELKSKRGKAMNLVHRDVSPHNILVGTDGVSRITDFGVARAEARLSTTRGGQLKGKIAYMPPEQGLGNDVDRRADVYAAGVCLWEMLTGRRLFKADHDGQLIAMILQGAQEAPIELVPDLPRELDEVCMKALSLRPDDRFATAAHFAETLESALYEAGIRMASTRQVAAFVDEFKVEVRHDSVPPVLVEDSVTGVDSLPSGRVSLASMPEPSVDESSVDGQAASVTGIGTLRPVGTDRATQTKKKRMLYAGAGALAAVAAIVVIAVSGGEAPTLAASQAAAQAKDAATGVQQRLDEPPAVAPKSPEPPVAAASTDKSSEAQPPEAPPAAPVTDAASRPVPPSTPHPVRAPAPTKKKPTKNPLDFETDSL